MPDSEKIYILRMEQNNASMGKISDKYLGVLLHFVMNFHNETSEFIRPHLRPSFGSILPFFLFFYGAIFILGVVLNTWMLCFILSRWKKLKDPFYKYLACGAINEIIKCLVVLPASLMTLLIHNWLFGSSLCYIFPMLQDSPFHASILTVVVTHLDRYRVIVYPLKRRLPPSLVIISVWIGSFIAVLPYAVYTHYLELEKYFGTQFKGVGICAINMADNIQEYIKGLFIALYLVPLGLVAFMYVRTTAEIQSRQSSVSVVLKENCTENQARGSVCTASSVAEPSAIAVSNLLSPETIASSNTARLSTDSNTSSWKCSNIGTDTGSPDSDDFNPIEEDRIQTFLLMVILTFALCLLPLNLVRILRHVVHETVENSFHFDITFIIVVWIAFLPSIGLPIYFFMWQKGLTVSFHGRRRLIKPKDHTVMISNVDDMESKLVRT